MKDNGNIVRLSPRSDSPNGQAAKQQALTEQVKGEIESLCSDVSTLNGQGELVGLAVAMTFSDGSIGTAFTITADQEPTMMGAIHLLGQRHAFRRFISEEWFGDSEDE